MFRLTPAALLFIQLSVMYEVFAVSEPPAVDRRDAQVFRGDSVTLTCNKPTGNTIQINWVKDRFIFSHLIKWNLTFSNFTSQRLRPDQAEPLNLTISDAQLEDAGLYTCSVTAQGGSKTTEWNLTVSEKPGENSSSWSFLYILTPAAVLLLCGFTSAVCLCSRKLKSRTTNQDPVQDQFHLETVEEVVPQPRGGTDTRTNDRQRSHYKERLNSIYGAF